MNEYAMTSSQLFTDFGQFRFRQGTHFAWLPASRTIVYAPIDTDEGLLQLLHEIAHAQLGHDTYRYDVQLLSMERQAWEYAVCQLAPSYQLTLSMDQAIVQESLNSYREWLHQRSCCPRCSAVGLEYHQHHYRCLHCLTVWRVNEAKTCTLRRYQLSPPDSPKT